MGIALGKLSDEDPTFKIFSDIETSDTIISGMGELHLEIIVDRLKREFGVVASTGAPQVAYRETIQSEAEAEYKHIKQSGGRGQYGHVKIKIKPFKKPANAEEKIPKNTYREEGYEFINNIKGGVIPQEYIPAVRKGIRESMDRGVLAGYPITNVSANLFDGSFHDVDSSEIAFKIAASYAFSEAVKRANPGILEPIMSIEVVTPEKFLGDVNGNLSSKRGQVLSVDDRGEIKVIKAKVPLAELFGYTTALRSMTEGGASATMEFDSYQIVPAHIAEGIINSRGK